MGDMQDGDIAELAAAVIDRERPALAAALNLLDDSRDAQRQRAAALLRELARRCGPDNGHLVGITGPPGAGKSSLGASLLREWRGRGLTVGVLAVDPSSPLSGGSLLGDRLRMQTGMADDGVFIRSLASRGEFGGLSGEVWPMSLVLLASFDLVLIETVGVGQREVDIARMCDTTCFVAQPGSGDSVQFLKAGILEVPHILVVNKSDMGEVARRTLSELGAALSRRHPDGDWEVPVLATSALQHSGIAELADSVESHRRQLQRAGVLDARRRHYQACWLLKRLSAEFGSFGVDRLGGESALEARLADLEISPYEHLFRLRAECRDALRT